MNKYVALVLFPLPGLLLTLFIVIFAWVLFPGIIHGEVEKQIRLVPGSDTWNKWKEAPIPIYLEFYVYNVINPDEVENGLTPKFEEKGPYSYRQKRVKVDIKQENGKNTVKYREVKTFFFDQKRSGENRESDLVNVPNIPFVAVIHTIKKMIPLDLVAGIVGNIVLNNEPFMRRNITVKELLFQGFDVTKYTNSVLGRQLPKEFSGGRFGLYKGKNGTASEVWEVYTGVENSFEFGKLKTWDGRDQLGFWQPYSPCDKLKGTDGSVFQPFITKETVLDAFSPDVCRSLPLVYSEDIEHLDIPGYRFRASAMSFEDPRIEEANRCFCLEKQLEDCAHAGVLPLESCTKAPIWTSSPHFKGADIRYLAESGLDPPVDAKHETFIDIEPTTGLTLRAHKRLQFNLEVRYNRKVRSLQKLTKEVVLFPLVWADENAELDEKIANELKGQLFTPLKIVGIAKWVVLVIGLLLFTGGLAFVIQRYMLNSNKPETVETKKQSALANLARSASQSSGSTSGSFPMPAESSGNKQRRKRSSIGIVPPARATGRESSTSAESVVSYIR